MDPQLCREHLEKLLAEEVALLIELERLLLQEHTVLVSNELTALEAAGDARQARMSALVRIQEERRALLRMHGYSGDHEGVNKLLTWCDPRQTLRGDWRRCGELAAVCRQHNERNAALVAARMKRVESLLEVIVGPGTHAGVYSASGARDAARFGGIFAAEA